MARTTPLAALAMAITLAGCSHTLRTEIPEPISLPESYPTLQQIDAKGDSATTRDAVMDLRKLDEQELGEALIQWWTLFQDPVLDSLIQQALAGNWTLQAAEQRIEQARAQILRVNAMARPSLDLSVSASRQQSGTTSKLGFGLYDLYGFGANLAWEPDVYGRIAARAQSAEQQLQVQQYDRQGIKVALVAELVDAYAQLRATQALLNLSQQYVAILKEQLELTRKLYASGLIPAASVASVQSDLLTAQSRLPGIKARIDALMTTCSVLAGGFPDDLANKLKNLSPMLKTGLALPATVPSQLLAQRPDIAAQQARMRSSLAMVQAAEADFMPRFEIPLSVGYSTTPFDLLLNPASFVWSLAASVTAPLYTGEALEANLTMAKAISKEDQLNYEAIVRQALKEVQDAVMAYQMGRLRLADTQAMLKQQASVLERQKTLYQTGQSSLLQLNEARLQWLLARQALIDASYASTTELTMLYRALGAGWTPQEVGAKDNMAEAI